MHVPVWLCACVCVTRVAHALHLQNASNNNEHCRLDTHNGLASSGQSLLLQTATATATRTAVATATATAQYLPAILHDTPLFHAHTFALALFVRVHLLIWQLLLSHRRFIAILLQLARNALACLASVCACVYICLRVAAALFAFQIEFL